MSPTELPDVSVVKTAGLPDWFVLKNHAFHLGIFREKSSKISIGALTSLLVNSEFGQIVFGSDYFCSLLEYAIFSHGE